MKNKIIKQTKTQNDDYFDDCPVCQAMKKAEERGENLSESELKQAFQKAKDKGAVVGGPLLDEDKKN